MTIKHLRQLVKDRGLKKGEHLLVTQNEYAKIMYYKTLQKHRVNKYGFKWTEIVVNGVKVYWL